MHKALYILYNTAEPRSDGQRTAAVAGGVVGALVGLMLIVLLVFVIVIVSKRFALSAKYQGIAFQSDIFQLI